MQAYYILHATAQRGGNIYIKTPRTYSERSAISRARNMQLKPHIEAVTVQKVFNGGSISITF
jgi:hypothetical protein